MAGRGGALELAGQPALLNKQIPGQWETVSHKQGEQLGKTPEIYLSFLHTPTLTHTQE